MTGSGQVSGPPQKYWRCLSGPRRAWLRPKCSPQLPAAIALFSLPDDADHSETPSPYFHDGRLARRIHRSPPSATPWSMAAGPQLPAG